MLWRGWQHGKVDVIEQTSASAASSMTMSAQRHDRHITSFLCCSLLQFYFRSDVKRDRWHRCCCLIGDMRTMILQQSFSRSGTRCMGKV
jgi:hypothetical protein